MAKARSEVGEQRQQETVVPRVAPADRGTTPLTTLMFKNLPRMYTPPALVQELEAHVEKGNIDFVYVPWMKGDANNMGFAFVNLVTPAAAETVMRAMHGGLWRLAERCRKVIVIPARVQGFAQNLGHCAHKIPADADKYMCPLVWRSGEEIEFRTAVRLYGRKSAGSTKQAGAAAAAAAVAKAEKMSASSCGDVGAVPRAKYASGLPLSDVPRGMYVSDTSAVSTGAPWGEDRCTPPLSGKPRAGYSSNTSAASPQGSSQPRLGVPWGAMKMSAASTEGSSCLLREVPRAMFASDSTTASTTAAPRGSLAGALTGDAARALWEGNTSDVSMFALSEGSDPSKVAGTETVVATWDASQRYASSGGASSLPAGLGGATDLDPQVASIKRSEGYRASLCDMHHLLLQLSAAMQGTAGRGL